MCLMKPNYDMWKHYFYLNKVRLKWVEQLQELLFDKKEFIQEGRYLFYMDELKENYKLADSIVNDRNTDMDKVKFLIEIGQFQCAINNVEQELGYMENIKGYIKVMEDKKKGVNTLTCSRKDLLAYCNEQVRYDSMNGKFTTGLERPRTDVVAMREGDDDDEEGVEVRERTINGVDYYVGTEGEYMNVVFTTDAERVGVLVDDNIVFD